MFIIINALVLLFIWSLFVSKIAYNCNILQDFMYQIKMHAMYQKQIIMFGSQWIGMVLVNYRSFFMSGS